MEVAQREWLQLLREEYLDDFVRGGGAAVKFAVVADRPAGTLLLAAVERAAADLGYLTARVDAAHVRVHMMQDVFHAVANRMPWDRLARAVVARAYARAGLRVEAGDLNLERVAAANMLDASILRVRVQQDLEDLLSRSSELAKDFRFAMLWLCIAQGMSSSSQRADEQAIVEWLQGELRLISAVKRLLIFRRIGRHNARAMLASLGAWCRMAGNPGLVVTLDIRQLGVARRADARRDEHFYTPAAAMDAYEVLRQLIDTTDELEGVLCIVLADPALFEDDRRGVRRYKALYERVWPDVRLRQRANPLSSLTELAPEEITA